MTFNAILLLFFKDLFINFIFWLWWLFLPVCGPSLDVGSKGYPLLQCAGFSLQWLLWLQSTGSRHEGFSSCSTHPLQYSCLEKPMDGGAWWAAVHGVAKSWTHLSDFTFPFHFHALEKEMATHSGVLAWRIPGTGEPGGLPSMGSHRVGHDWSDLAAAALEHRLVLDFLPLNHQGSSPFFHIRNLRPRRVKCLGWSHPIHP